MSIFLLLLLHDRCQTAFFNSLEDFCLWGLPELDTVGNTEARAIAWCTQEGHGTRVMPAGTIKAAQWIVTDSYVQVTGQLEQQNINIEADDAGGEMDPGAFLAIYVEALFRSWADKGDFIVQPERSMCEVNSCVCEGPN